MKLMGGENHYRIYNGWHVSWETNNHYRHWCRQSKNDEWETLLILMLNPGSLSGDGSNLGKDVTLRILRTVCGEAKLNTCVVNLFDYATPKPTLLSQNWEVRDFKELIYPKLDLAQFIGFLPAYGDLWDSKKKLNIHKSEIVARIEEAEKLFEGMKQASLPLNKNGTPKHPMMWQIEKRQMDVASVLKQTFHQ